MLIAKKPCSFGGRQFFIDDEIPAELVADPTTQVRFGILAVINTDDNAEGMKDGKAHDEYSGVFYTQEEVDVMVSEAVAAAVSEMEQKQEELQRSIVLLQQTNPEMCDGIIAIDINGTSDGENEQMTPVFATREDVQKVFEIMQMNADEGVKVVTHVMSENVLILLHAVDGRKTIKDAAKKRADILFMFDEKAVVQAVFTDVNTATISNATVEVNAAANMEGADA